MKNISLFILAILLIAGCTTSKKSSTSTHNSTRQDALDTSSAANQAPLHPSPTRLIDILHTKLSVSFDWEKQYLFGKATIKLKPYFYPTSKVILDAKNFDIKSIYLTDSIGKKLTFTYDTAQVFITLDKIYTRNDSLTLFIDYVAKPNDRKTVAGTAITSDKGLYFINPLGEEKDKPTQLWTQGEPESNSCWFPTVDKPNERMTQEIYITLDSAHKKFVTLSNGMLLSSINNPNGSRTDYWKQTLPAAPYLTMMAVGDFTIVKDKWKKMEVNYYVEHEYANYAMSTFGNTPEMLEFFSNKLQTPYPWEKYSQVVVRDYVSGAMENTTAVIHGSFLNQTNREMLDNSFEDVISHELFHHWFGDYVTCEQWSNLTMNEGFATYGEYLWQEHKYGRDAADAHARESMFGYLSSAAKEPRHLIRYRYDAPDDMFDAHSYNKGGAVIHMLRKYVGDDAFFISLKKYLEINKHTSVEADNLRLVFEQTTGEDLKWFFDQWFYGIGHPKLLIRHSYNDSLKKYYVDIQQTQDLAKFPPFVFPLDIDIYIDGKVERSRVWVNEASSVFTFPVAHKPDLVNVDAEKALLCLKEEKKSISEWAFQYKHCPLYVDRLEAIKECIALSSIPEATEILIAALKDISPDIRERAIAATEKYSPENKEKVKSILINLAKADTKSSVRAASIHQLSKFFEGNELTPLFRESVSDSSYAVAGSALDALAKVDANEALAISKKFESEKNTNMLMAIAQIYALHGSDENNQFFIMLSDKMSGWGKVGFANVYSEFLKRCSDETINSGLVVLEKIARTEDNRWVRHFGQKGIKDLAQMYSNRIKEISSKIANMKSPADSELKSLEKQLAQAKIQEQKLKSLHNTLKTPE